MPSTEADAQAIRQQARARKAEEQKATEKLFNVACGGANPPANCAERDPQVAEAVRATFETTREDPSSPGSRSA